MPHVEQLTGNEGGDGGGKPCVPIFHFDVSGGEVDELVQNPVSFLKKIGVELHSSASLEIGRVSQSYSEEGWRELEKGDTAETYWPGMCCHIVDGNVKCFLK